MLLGLGNGPIPSSDWSLEGICSESDKTKRLITGLGPVFRAPKTPQEYKWKVRFSSREDDHRFVDVGAGFLRNLRLASCWRGDTLVEHYETRLVRTLHLDFDNQTLLSLVNDDTSEPTFQPYARELDAPPFIALPVKGDEEIDFAVVRCSEVIRYWFGHTSILSQHLFDFRDDGSNPHLYVSNRSGFRNSRTYEMRAAPGITHEDAVLLARFISWEAMRDQMVHVARSARRLFSEDRPVWPILRAPESGVLSWEVYGNARPFDLQTLAIKGRALGVAQILSSSATAPVDKVIAHVDSSTREKSQAEFPSQQENHGLLGKKVRAQSDVPPGPVAKPVVDHATRTIDLFPGLAHQWVEIRKTKTSRTSISTFGGEGVPIDALSSQPGRSGTASVAQGRQAMRDNPVETSEEKEPELEQPREHLPLLFGHGFRAELTWGFEPPVMLPRYLRFLGLGAKLLIKSRRPCSLFGYEEGEGLPVITLPRSWGRNVVAPDAPHGLRRAVMCKLSGLEHDVVFFDLERVGSQRIGIHCMAFRAGTCPDSPEVLAEVFHYRLEKKIWPTRLTHNGTFWTCRMNHSPARIHVDQSAANLIVRHASEFAQSLG